jgi:hypothetical protein
MRIINKGSNFITLINTLSGFLNMVYDTTQACSRCNNFRNEGNETFIIDSADTLSIVMKSPILLLSVIMSPIIIAILLDPLEWLTCQSI